ncbi:hypothetical protein ACFUCV_07695 [Specibacter sp. NPDC057265]|uniref:AMIN-like domain-containing (lipo)protein n=1 Tax=Specibacter sp. NPDC057265 TaxID=3346075 RepID=UPI00362C4777
MKSIKSILAVVGLLAAFLIAGPAPAQAASYCGITWGSAAKSAGVGSSATVSNVRTGEQLCFDRLVIDLQGRANGYSVAYVSAVTSPGSGQNVALRGGAFIRITVKAPAYNSAGTPTYLPSNRNELSNVAGYATFRQVAMAGSYEGSTTLGLGVRARLPFRVLVLAGPGDATRVVVDVAHRW